MIKALLDGGANPFIALPDGTNALMLAAGQGYGGVRGDGIRIVVPTAESAAEAVQLLLDRGVDIDSFTTAGNTALHAAINRGEPVVRVLASRGARSDQEQGRRDPVRRGQRHRRRPWRPRTRRGDPDASRRWQSSGSSIRRRSRPTKRGTKDTTQSHDIEGK